MLMSRAAMQLRSLRPYDLQRSIVAAHLVMTLQESVMKKFVPFVFIVIMAGLIGGKFAIAGETAAASPGSQLEQLN